MPGHAPNGLMVRFSSSHPDRITALVSSEFFRAGNAVLIDDPARPVQLRRYTLRERQYVDPSDPVDNALLIHRNNGRLLSAHFVTLSRDRMDNTPENVEAAIADLAEHEPLRALVLRRAVNHAAEAAREAASRPIVYADGLKASASKRATRRARRAETKKGGAA